MYKCRRSLLVEIEKVDEATRSDASRIAQTFAYGRFFVEGRALMEQSKKRFEMSFGTWRPNSIFSESSQTSQKYTKKLKKYIIN